jgi:hypothetical protein
VEINMKVRATAMRVRAAGYEEYNDSGIKVNDDPDEFVGDIVVACKVCGQIGIAEEDENLDETLCNECGNSDWEQLPFVRTDKKDELDVPTTDENDPDMNNDTVEEEFDEFIDADDDGDIDEVIRESTEASMKRNAGSCRNIGNEQYESIVEKFGKDGSRVVKKVLHRINKGADVWDGINYPSRGHLMKRLNEMGCIEQTEEPYGITDKGLRLLNYLG